MTLGQWLETKQGEFWEEKAHQQADDGDAYYDDLIQTSYELFCEDTEIVEKDNRTYDDKFSYALTKLQILRGTLEMIASDAKHLRKRNDYTLKDFEKDFAKTEKAFQNQLDYLTEMTKEIQKTYKMY